MPLFTHLGEMSTMMPWLSVPAVSRANGMLLGTAVVGSDVGVIAGVANIVGTAIIVGAATFVVGTGNIIGYSLYSTLQGPKLFGTKFYSSLRRKSAKNQLNHDDFCG